MVHLVRRAARRLSTYWQILTRRERVTSEMDEEMRFHVEMETERLMIKHGLPLEEARRRAFVNFGGVEKYREAGHDVHGLRWLDALLLDARFSLRMLLKHRGLTMVGAFAMAVAIAVGATAFEAISDVLDSPLPLPGGDRLVALEFIGTNPGSPEQQVIHEFAALRGSLTTVEHFSGYQNAQHNLVAAETAPEPVMVAEITPSAFAITNTPALIGRYLLPSDESNTAAPVVVIGYQAWQLRFASDPNVVGRTVHLGGVPRTVVGVMPDGFEFPTSHQFWIPLTENPLEYAQGEGPELSLFGRLARGVTIEQAQAEIATVVQPTVAARAVNGEQLRPLVLPYSQQVIEDPAVLWTLQVARWLVGVLTVVVAINLAILVYARTVTRLGEIAVRSALGASRRRILAQLYIEALALALVGAAAGLGLASYMLDVIQTLNDTGQGLPYWIRFELSPQAGVFALGLALISALIMGVLPGLKATGAGVNANLHELHGRSGTRLGATWTTLIVAQVAVAVAVLPVAVFIASRVIRSELAGPGFPAESIVVARMALAADAPARDQDATAAPQLKLLTKLEAEPGVTSVAFSEGVPGFAVSRQIRFEDGVRVRAQAEHVPDVGVTDAFFPSATSVSVDAFAHYGVQIVGGRTFTASDVGTTNVVVNRSFVDMYLQEPNALGVSFRFENKAESAAPVRWYQIVGVVRDFPAFPMNFTRDAEPTIYHPAGIGEIPDALVSVRFAGSVPPAFIDRYREIGAEVDPALQLLNVGVLADRYDELRSVMRALAWATALITASVLLLSAAGVYALMSFTVAQRTREIGIRTALGAPPRRVVLNVFGRAARQVAAGVLVGSVLAAGAFAAIGLGMSRAMPLLIAVAVIMALVALLATWGPARRGVRIQAIEALRADA